MRTSGLVLALALGSVLVTWASRCPAQEQVAVAVMEFTSKGGVDQDQMDALGDLLANEIRNMGPYRVIGKSDIRAALHIEQQRALLGCDGTSCIAEVGGALGVRWVVLGNISLFGKTYLLNLKMMDAAKVTVASSVSRTVKGEQDQLIDLLPEALRALFANARKEIWPDGAPKVMRPVTPAVGEWKSLPAGQTAAATGDAPDPPPPEVPTEPVPPKAPVAGPEPPKNQEPVNKPKPPAIKPPPGGNPWQVVPADGETKKEGE